ncbi:D-allose-binding periplasmic protein [Moorella thermoacetica]|uniref:D-allose-binding periplasmic protein n=1 Tax=Neomoorella thermoacetica TaxID=1525 RepID=A0AAC9MUF4_NEOTH|nr:sugar-binding protein [Moorella thermoacetica]AOQ23492.1 D-allose-binding periplasmic protein precursor [Moorella thermoacetica]TYL13677.1 D-allose-binding periplasmic protein [Moorella thermoacetica]
MLSKKRILALFLTLIMVAALVAGCGQKSSQQSANSSSSKDKQLHLVFVSPLIGHPIWLVAKEGFDDAAKKYGFQGDWVGPQGIDANAMIQQIENAIASKADGIITMALNPEAFQPVLEKAQKAGIPVVLVNSDAPNAPRLAFIGTDEKNLGTIGAKEIIKKLNGTPAKVLTMQSTMDAKVANKMREAYEEELKKAPGTEILARESDNSDMMTAVQKFQNLLRTYPQTNVIIGVAAEVGPAAAKVVDEMGLKDKVNIIAIDDMKETLDYIRSGVIYGTLTQNFYRMGYQAAQLLVENIKEGKKPSQQVIDSGTIFVTKDNIDTYKEQMKKW